MRQAAWTAYFSRSAHFTTFCQRCTYARLGTLYSGTYEEVLCRLEVSLMLIINFP